MSKSSKRIKLETEIFSKSIKDIELMFNFSHEQENHLGSKRKLSKTTRSQDGIPAEANRLEQKIPKVQVDLPTGLGIRHIEVDYDCINMSFFSDSQNESDDEAPFVLAPNQFVSQPTISPPQCAPEMALSSQSLANASTHSLRNPGIASEHQVLLDLNDDDEIDGYSFGSDLKQYLPRMNLESDLKRIDQMFAAPSLLTKIS